MLQRKREISEYFVCICTIIVIRYVLIITKSEMIIFHCFCCFWASLGLIPWAIARYAPAVLHPNLLQNQLKTIES